MEYFCEHLNKELTFFHDQVKGCCEGASAPVYYEHYTGEKIIWENFLKMKEEFFASLNDTDIKGTPCDSCFHLRPRKETDIVSSKYKILHMSHWTQCNCGCIYCARMTHSKGDITQRPGKSNYYDMLPIIKGLYKNDLLDKENLVICIQGGDISVLKEFEAIVKECYRNGFKEAIILTNNIIYQPIIRRILKDKKGSLTTSLDCGTREMYLKIKRVDKFEQTIANLRKYVKDTKTESITVRYIIVDSYNDNIEEITVFLNLMAAIGIKNVQFQLDNKWALFTDFEKTPLPSNYFMLYNFFKEKSAELGLNFSIEDKPKYVIEKYGTQDVRTL